MPTNHETLLCRYHYDPLDRLVACTLSEEQANTQRFYQKSRLATEIQGSMQRSIFQQEDQLLAQQQSQRGTVESTLLATDQQRSVLNALNGTPPRSFAYTPYGHRSPESGLFSLLGFNGERPDPVTGHYLLGNGYRAFNPVLMRFNSPDSWSPFGEGGLNAYAYCVGDPVNREDRTGHASGFLGWIMKSLGKTPRKGYTTLRSSSSNLAGSKPTTVTTLAESAGPSQGSSGSGTPLLKLEKTKTIKKIEDPIARNQAKLKNVDNELANLKTNEDAVVRETVSQSSGGADFLDAETYEAIVRRAVPKRILELEQRKSHYTEKISTLRERSLAVRNQ